ncbi:MAG: flagellar brake protein [Hydrogenophilaceae bacterium]|nr:flagellar brake protein [Hydrogenophilaceae bacterium]
MAEALFPYNPKDIKLCGFDDMNLQVGARLEVQRLPPGLNPRLFTRVIGYASGESLLVRTPLVNKLPADLREGDKVYVRTFSGTRAFGFASSVQRLCIAPFLYMHLDIPKEVQYVEIRRDQRLPVKLLAQIKGAGDWQPVLMLDLAEGGSLVESTHAVGEAGTAVELRFSFPLEHLEQEVTLSVAGKLHSAGVHRREDGLQAYRYGVEFNELSGNDAVLLQNFLFKILLDSSAKHG